MARPWPKRSTLCLCHAAPGPRREVLPYFAASLRPTAACRLQGCRAQRAGRKRSLAYPWHVTAAHDYSDLHELIERLEPDQAEELREHALRLVKSAGGRFKVLRPFDGPRTDLGARAKEVIRAELGQSDADR